MPSGNIDIDEFENADADGFKQRNDTERIVSFLDRNGDRAWKAATVAERLGLETDTVSALLSRLKDRDLVRHKRPYWAITDDKERLQSAYRLHRQYKRADDQYGEERLEDLQTEDTEEVQ
jgi:predicted ArsR family transcriptional regulator